MDLKELKVLATKYNGYLNGDTSLYDDLNDLSAEEIKVLKEKYKPDASKGKPVNLLRYVNLSTIE